MRHRHRGRELHARGSRPPAPRHGDIQARRHHQHFETEVHRGHERRAATTANSPSAASSRSRASANTAFRKATPRASPIWFTPRAWMKCHYPGCVRGGAAQQPADGLLRAGADRARCAGARRRGAAGRRQRRTGIAPWRTVPRPANGCTAAMPRCEDDIRTTHALRLGFRQISGFSEDDGHDHREACAARASIPSAISGCARGLHPSALERLAEADAFRSLGLTPARCAVGGARAAALRRQGRPAAVRARRHAGARARRRACRRCCRASRSSRITGTCTCR